MNVNTRYYCVACGNVEVDSGHFAREHGAVMGGVAIHGEVFPQHSCQPPPLPAAGTVMLPPDWECGICGRLWQAVGGPSGGAWWAEVRGPRPPADPALFSTSTPEPEPCTGMTATWCPTHGECRCTNRLEDGEFTLDDFGCPLHGADSPHAADKPGSRDQEEPHG